MTAEVVPIVPLGTDVEWEPVWPAPPAPPRKRAPKDGNGAAKSLEDGPVAHPPAAGGGAPPVLAITGPPAGGPGVDAAPPAAGGIDNNEENTDASDSGDDDPFATQFMIEINKNLGVGKESALGAAVTKRR